MPYVLVLYYSAHGATAELAMEVARGIDSVDGIEARIRTVPPVAPVGNSPGSKTAEPSWPFASLDDLRECAGLALGCPTRFGNMPAAMKYFLDGTSELWMEGALVDKPAGVFTSTASMHGGQETTLVSMMFPLLHHGMIICGVPYTSPDLMETTSGGTPYGPSRVSGASGDRKLEPQESGIARHLGKRLARIALASITDEQ